jgi:HAD superfamily hydrolase (TIGR01509 family)
MTANPYSLVVFDCDGVLVDSEVLCTEIEARLLTEMGFPHTQADVVARFMGRTDGDNFARIVELMGERGAEEFDARATEETREAFRTDLAPVAGVAEVLDALDAEGRPYCVASSGSHRRMRTTLGATGLWGRLEGRIYSADDVGRGKPWPDVFIHAAAAQGHPARACVVVEDSVSGVLAGVAAGMDVLGYSGGLADADALAGAGAKTFGAMAELPDLIRAGRGRPPPRSAAPVNRDAVSRRH